MLNGCLWLHDGPLDVAHAQSVARVQTAPKRWVVHQAHKKTSFWLQLQRQSDRGGMDTYSHQKCISIMIGTVEYPKPAETHSHFLIKIA